MAWSSRRCSCLPCRKARGNRREDDVLSMRCWMQSIDGCMDLAEAGLGMIVVQIDCQTWRGNKVLCRRMLFVNRGGQKEKHEEQGKKGREIRATARCRGVSQQASNATVSRVSVFQVRQQLAESLEKRTVRCQESDNEEK